MPSPDVIASYLVARTQRAKIAILGNATPLRDHPLRVAEEVAMMDVISGGRVVCGFVRGIGPEYHNFTMNPATSLERFREAHDLIVESWTRPGPFRWEGKHYRFEYVNPWPRPLQQPHPPIWIPSQGSGETIGWAAERRYTFIVTSRRSATSPASWASTARPRSRSATTRSRSRWLGAPRLRRRDRRGRHRRGEAARRVSLQPAGAPPAPVFFPPGYLSEDSAKNVLRASPPSARSAPPSSTSTTTRRSFFHRLRRDRDAPPPRVHRRVRHRHARPPSAVRLDAPRASDRHMERIAEQVMPALRDHVSAVYR